MDISAKTDVGYKQTDPAASVRGNLIWHEIDGAKITMPVVKDADGVWRRKVEQSGRSIMFRTRSGERGLGSRITDPIPEQEKVITYVLEQANAHGIMEDHARQVIHARDTERAVAKADALAKTRAALEVLCDETETAQPGGPGEGRVEAFRNALPHLPDDALLTLRRAILATDYITVNF